MLARPRSPARLDVPSLLVNFPFSVDARHKNNVLMYQDDKPYHLPRAFSQFMGLYHMLAEQALVYVLPTADLSLQDLPYVANLGCFLPHIHERDVMLLSNFKSAPRAGEAAIGRPFFHMLNYEVHSPPHHWEGEADLKWLRDSIYIGGHNIRSDLAAFRWMAETFGMTVIELKLEDEKLYHLDCSVFPLGPRKVLAATGFKQLEGHTEVIAVPPEYIYHGWTNSIRIGYRVFHAPHSLPSAVAFRKILAKHQFELVTVPLDEFEKSGADLSCLVMHLNRHG